MALCQSVGHHACWPEVAWQAKAAEFVARLREERGLVLTVGEFLDTFDSELTGRTDAEFDTRRSDTDGVVRWRGRRLEPMAASGCGYVLAGRTLIHNTHNARRH